MWSHLIQVACMFFVWYICAFWIDYNNIPDIHPRIIEILQHSMLIIGLYGAVYGIDVKHIQSQKKTIILLVSIGVISKMILIGGWLYMITWSSISRILGAMMAQIDPLSTVKLSSREKLSPQWKAILNTRASFDDPMTVLIVFYLLVPVLFGQGFGVDSYLISLVSNVVFAGMIYILSLISDKKYHIILRIVSVITAIYFGLFLGIAIIGLYLRPLYLYKYNFEEIVSRMVSIAFMWSVVLAWGYLYHSAIQNMHILRWITLGVLVFFSQSIVSYIALRHLQSTDLHYIAHAQYNGITSLILATSLYQYENSLVGYVCIAIVIVMCLYTFSNYHLDKGSLIWYDIFNYFRK